MELLLVLTLAAPVLGMLGVLLLPDPDSREHRRLAVVAMLAAAAGALGMVLAYDPGQTDPQFAFELGWLEVMGLRCTLFFGVDGLSLPLVAVSTLVGLAAVLAGGQVTHRTRSYYALLLALVGAALAAFSSYNVLLFFLFVELATLPKYLLVSVWGELPPGEHGHTRESAATQQLLYVTAGAMVALLGLLGVIFKAGGSCDLMSLAQRHIDPELQRWLFGLLLAGFGVWTSFWPLHSWSPPAYAAAPPAASMLFAGVIKNLGAFGLLRIGAMLLPEGLRFWSSPMAILAMLGILIAGWTAMRQKEWQPMLAYSSVSHAGYFLLGLASLNLTGLTGAAFFLSAHALMVAACFGLAGWITVGSGQRAIAGFGGLAQRLPFVGTAMSMAILAGVGLPGFANFWGELLILMGAFRNGSLATRLAAIAAVWGLVVTATYMLRALHRSFFGPPVETGPTAALRDPATWQERLPFVLLLGALLLLGFWPRLILGPAEACLAPLDVLLQGARTLTGGRL